MLRTQRWFGHGHSHDHLMDRETYEKEGKHITWVGVAANLGLSAGKGAAGIFLGRENAASGVELMPAYFGLTQGDFLLR